MVYACAILICLTVMEWTDPSKTALCTTIITLFIPVGLMLLSGIVYLIHNWRILQLVLFSPLLLVLGLFYWSAASQSVIIWHVHQDTATQNIAVENIIVVLNLWSNRFVPESARWLMTQGRKEEALKELKRAARVNGRTVPEDLLDKVSCIKHTFTSTKIYLTTWWHMNIW